MAPSEGMEGTAGRGCCLLLLLACCSLTTAGGPWCTDTRFSTCTSTDTIDTES